MTYYLVAGEASGDLHGANLMKSLKDQDPQAVFRYFGGDRMKNEGGVLVKHYADMAFMGFTEVILNLRTILKNLSFCKQDILSFNPDVLILIDFPGFNLKIADFAKKKGVKVCFYISPKVWAWNQKRVLKIKQNVDKMFCILPFEVDFYKKWGMEVDYVGNPLLDEKSQFKQNPDFLKGFPQQKIIALLPGSRKQEIERLLPNMVQVSNQFPDHHFVVAAAPGFEKDYYDQLIGGRNISLIFGQTYDLLAVADAALVASGTATLETALFKVPQVVVYKGGTISIAIARALVKIRFISLVNLIMDRQVVKELIQSDCNPEKIAHHLKQITTGPERKIMLNDYEELAKRMGLPGASEKTAKLIAAYLKSN
jgi:lipid-A-disaccharide synthase